MLFFSKIIINVSVKVISIFKKIVSFIIKILSYPVNIIYSFLEFIIIKPIIHFSTKFKNILKKSINKQKNTNKNNEILQNKEGF